MACTCDVNGVRPGVCDHCIGLEQRKGWNLVFLSAAVVFLAWLFRSRPDQRLAISSV